jgi:hypothetical protein
MLPVYSSVSSKTPLVQKDVIGEKCIPLELAHSRLGYDRISISANAA